MRVGIIIPYFQEPHTTKTLPDATFVAVRPEWENGPGQRVFFVFSRVSFCHRCRALSFEVAPRKEFYNTWTTQPCSRNLRHYRIAVRVDARACEVWQQRWR